MSANSLPLIVIMLEYHIKITLAFINSYMLSSHLQGVQFLHILNLDL